MPTSLIRILEVMSLAQQSLNYLWILKLVGASHPVAIGFHSNLYPFWFNLTLSLDLINVNFVSSVSPAKSPAKLKYNIYKLI